MARCGKGDVRIAAVDHPADGRAVQQQSLAAGRFQPRGSLSRGDLVLEPKRPCPGAADVDRFGRVGDRVEQEPWRPDHCHGSVEINQDRHDRTRTVDAIRHTGPDPDNPGTIRRHNREPHRVSRVSNAHDPQTRCLAVPPRRRRERHRPERRVLFGAEQVPSVTPVVPVLQFEKTVSLHERTLVVLGCGHLLVLIRFVQTAGGPLVHVPNGQSGRRQTLVTASLEPVLDQEILPLVPAVQEDLIPRSIGHAFAGSTVQLGHRVDPTGVVTQVGADPHGVVVVAASGHKAVVAYSP